MLKNNLLLIQLKQQFNSYNTCIEGTVIGTNKKFGFLEGDTKKKYFIPPHFMKKVMHGDKIKAIIHKEKKYEIAEPIKLIKPFLTRFIGQIQIKIEHTLITPEHPFIKNIILTNIKPYLNKSFQTGDWVIAKMCEHPLKMGNKFYAEIITLITTKDNSFVPWLIILAHHNIKYNSPKMPEKNLSFEKSGPKRIDLTTLDFITIDNDNTDEIDDALHITTDTVSKNWIMTVAIADPTAWISPGSLLDLKARERGFTIYLPGLNIPMLPRDLSSNLCSLHANKLRPALVCRVTILQDGTIANNAYFFTAWIQSKAKLTYTNVSNWLENNGSWQPENNSIENQIRLLYNVSQSLNAWRQRYALVLKDKPNYKFIIDKKGNVENIIIEKRLIANKMIEEAMIAVNICAARKLRDELGYGLYNTHNGFDPKLIDQAVSTLRNYHINVEPTDLLTLKGFCDLRRKLDVLSKSSLDFRINRFQNFAEVNTSPSPHFGLGLDVYATWTSPIRKYSDMLNHRLLKSLIGIGKAEPPDKDIISLLMNQRKKNRTAKKDLIARLYACFLKEKVENNTKFLAEIVDFSKNGIKVRLLENGAIAFIPVSFIKDTHKKYYLCDKNNIIQEQKNEYQYYCGNTFNVKIKKIKLETSSIIVYPV